MQTNLLARRALLATYNVGAWRASKLHKDETAEENTRHSTNACKVSITLTSHPALSLLNKHHAATRNEHYRLSLPSCDEGWRFLPCSREFEHAEMMREAKAEHQKLVDQFLTDYENERETAPVRLNGLYRAEFFPTLDKVAAKFKFQTRYMPVPEAGTWQDWLQEAGADATEELKTRFADALHAMMQKLNDADAIFRDSLVGNVKDLCELSGDLNLLNDPLITQTADAAAALAALDPDALREDKALRAETATKAKNILAALGGRL